MHEKILHGIIKDLMRVPVGHNGGASSDEPSGATRIEIMKMGKSSAGHDDPDDSLQLPVGEADEHIGQGARSEMDPDMDGKFEINEEGHNELAHKKQMAKLHSMKK